MLLSTGCYPLLHNFCSLLLSHLSQTTVPTLQKRVERLRFEFAQDPANSWILNLHSSLQHEDQQSLGLEHAPSHSPSCTVSFSHSGCVDRIGWRHFDSCTFTKSLCHRCVICAQEPATAIAHQVGVWETTCRSTKDHFGNQHCRNQHHYWRRGCGHRYRTIVL